MNSKHLSNVLLKILGLSVCLRAIPLCVSGIVSVIVTFTVPHGDRMYIGALSSAVGAGVEAVVGIFIICKSRNIAEFWFKNGNE